MLMFTRCLKMESCYHFLLISVEQLIFLTCRTPSHLVVGKMSTVRIRR
uniref:Uncharacterized protein n=1 Tax=Arundo donax TaxID=35708 RepID=A0A0A9EM66_ARUDO